MCASERGGGGVDLYAKSLHLHGSQIKHQADSISTDDVFFIRSLPESVVTERKSSGSDIQMFIYVSGISQGYF